MVESSSADRVRKLDRLQNKAIRRIGYCVDQIHRKDIDLLHEEYNIEKLSLRRKRTLVKIMHKRSKNNVNVNLVRPKIDLRSKSKVKMKNKFTSITKV